MPHQECGAEAGREGRLRLSHTLLRARHLGGVAAAWGKDNQSSMPVRRWGRELASSAPCPPPFCVAVQGAREAVDGSCVHHKALAAYEISDEREASAPDEVVHGLP